MNGHDVQIAQLAEGVMLSEDGIWVARRTSAVSYPSDASDWCYEVESSSFWFAHRGQCILEALAAFPPEGPLFDIGGGNGYVSALLERQGYDAVLVEPSSKGARNARDRGVVHVVCATLQDAGFRAGVIPAAGLFDVVEHVDDDLAFLENVRALLRPGGRVYVTVPAYRWLWSVDDVRAGHYRRYSRGEIVARLEQAGFVVERATYLFSFLVLPLLALRSIPSKLGLRKVESRGHTGEHVPGSPRLRAVLDWLSRREVSRLRAGRTIPFGTSCLVVARAKNA